MKIFKYIEKFTAGFMIAFGSVFFYVVAIHYVFKKARPDVSVISENTSEIALLIIGLVCFFYFINLFYRKVPNNHNDPEGFGIGRVSSLTFNFEYRLREHLNQSIKPAKSWSILFPLLILIIIWTLLGVFVYYNIDASHFKKAAQITALVAGFGFSFTYYKLRPGEFKTTRETIIFFVGVTAGLSVIVGILLS